MGFPSGVGRATGEAACGLRTRNRVDARFAYAQDWCPGCAATGTRSFVGSTLAMHKSAARRSACLSVEAARLLGMCAWKGTAEGARESNTCGLFFRR